MPNDPDRPRLRVRRLPARLQALIVLALVAGLGAGAWAVKSHTHTSKAADADAVSSQSKRPRGLFYPSAAQWATLTVEPAQQRVFRSERATEGKIAVDEDRSTPIFSPYAGRVTKLFVDGFELFKKGNHFANAFFNNFFYRFAFIKLRLLFQ